MKKIIKKSCGILVGFSLIAYASECNKPKLTNSIIKWLDNKPFALDCATMGDILHVRRGLRKIQYGIQDPTTKEVKGYYLFDGKYRSLQWLAQYEQELEQAYLSQKAILEKKYVVDEQQYNTDWNAEQLLLEEEHEQHIQELEETLHRSIKDTEERCYESLRLKRELQKEHQQDIGDRKEEVVTKHISNKEEYKEELELLQLKYKEALQAFAPCLLAAKMDFIKANAPFSTKMDEGTKKLVLKLIAEFCLKYKRPYSFLLEWAGVDAGQEPVIFERHIGSCRVFHEFITDLVDFLEALYYSCDKARAEFETKQKEKMQSGKK